MTLRSTAACAPGGPPRTRRGTFSEGSYEEAEAIGWYEQRISLEKDAAARAIMKDAQKEEFKHFSMDLEFLLRHKPDWRKILKGVKRSRWQWRSKTYC
jgi:hypothetical protein